MRANLQSNFDKILKFLTKKDQKYSKLVSKLLSSSMLRLFSSILKPSSSNQDVETEVCEKLRQIAESRYQKKNPAK